MCSATPSQPVHPRAIASKPAAPMPRPTPTPSRRILGFVVSQADRLRVSPRDLGEQPADGSSRRNTVRAPGDPDGVGLRRGEPVRGQRSGSLDCVERVVCKAFERPRLASGAGVAHQRTQRRTSGRAALHLHRSAVLRQHRLLGPLRLLLRLAAPLAAQRPSRPPQHDARPEGRGARRQPVPPRRQGRREGVLRGRLPARVRPRARDRARRTSRSPSTTRSSSPTPATTGPPRRAGRRCSTG